MALNLFLGSKDWAGVSVSELFEASEALVGALVDAPCGASESCEVGVTGARLLYAGGDC